MPMTVKRDYNNNNKIRFLHIAHITLFKGIVLSSVFKKRMPLKCMIIALILIYYISSVLLEPKIAMKVILDPKMCEI